MSVTANNFSSDCRFIKSFTLFFIAEVVKGCQKHLCMERKRGLIIEEMSFKDFYGSIKGEYVVILVESKNLTPHVFHHVLPRLMKKGRVKPKNRVVVDHCLLFKIGCKSLWSSINEM